MSLFDRKTRLDNGRFNGIFDKVLDVVGLGTPDMPTAPDYTALAEQTADANLDLWNLANTSNHPNQTTPWGTSTWEQESVFDQEGYDQAYADWQSSEPVYEGNFLNTDVFNTAFSDWESQAPSKDDFTELGQWSQNVTLSPEQQAIFDQQQSNQLLQTDLAGQGLAATGDMFSTPFETGLDPLADFSDTRESIINSMMDRTRTDVDRDREARAGELVAQGIPRGSEAFRREMEDFDRRLTDAYQQAELYATKNIASLTDMERANRDQIIKELLSERQTPLNEYNALMTGTQVSNPQFTASPKTSPILGPDYLGAGQLQSNYDLAGWNADVAQNNAILSGLFDLASSAASG